MSPKKYVFVNYMLYILMKSWCKFAEDIDYDEICRSYVNDLIHRL
jgi:hypothetical protein